MATTIKVEISQAVFRKAEALLTRVPLELRTAVLPKALRAAAAPVVDSARTLAPDSQKTGSRKKWSKKTRASRIGSPSHKDTIGVSTVRQYGQVVAIYAGPVHPRGNLINIIGHPRKQVLWGRPTGRTIPATQYLDLAGRQTAARQQAAFVREVRRETNKILANK